MPCRTPRDSNWQIKWNDALKNVKCTFGNLICIHHFEHDTYIFKSNQYKLKEFAVPTIFMDSNLENVQPILESEPEVAECFLNESKGVNPENEIQFLRKLVASLELEKEESEKSLKEIIESKSRELDSLSKEINKLKEINVKFDSDFVRFVTSTDPNVSLIHFFKVVTQPIKRKVNFNQKITFGIED